MSSRIPFFFLLALSAGFVACPIIGSDADEGVSVVGIESVSGGAGGSSVNGWAGGSIAIGAAADNKGGKEKARGPATLSIMAWNAQHFFDAKETGAEFAEFKGPKSRWSVEKYSARLDRAREAILLAGAAIGAGPDRGPDVVVLEEIENARVLEDLCNRLPQRERYRYAAFVPPGPGLAFASAVITRYRIVSVTAHSVMVPSSPEPGTSLTDGPRLRPLLEATLDAGGTPVTVFAAHWKAKEDGVDTASVRRAQERALAERIDALVSRDPGALFVACGDFNQGVNDFETLGGGSTVSPWPDWISSCEAGRVPGPPGSYWYDGAWETIDNFFYPPPERSGYRVRGFRALATPPLVDESLKPARYEVFSGVGYSDHLPLVISLERMN